MIDVACTCGMREKVPESQVGKNWLCPSCGKTTHLICAEPLADGAGAGDFDASLTIVEGPARVGERYLLGGVAEIQLGKLPGKHILLPGHQVSRNHCALKRVDFGPSRWEVVDTNSTFGTFVNSEKAQERELVSGDCLTLGEFEVRYDVEASQDAPLPPAPVAASAHHPAMPQTPPVAPSSAPVAHAAPAQHLSPYPSSHPSHTPKAPESGGWFKRMFGRRH